MSSVPLDTSAAEQVLTSHDLLPIIWEGVDDAYSRTSLSCTQKAILQTIGTFATPTFRVPDTVTSPTYSIPRPPAGLAFQRPTKLIVRGAGPHQLLDVDTGAPWLPSWGASCGATLGSLELNGSSGPVLREWLQQLSPEMGQVPQLRHLQLNLGQEPEALAAHPLPPTLTSLILSVQSPGSAVQPAYLAVLAPLVNLASLDVRDCRNAPLSTLPTTALRSLTSLRCRPISGPDLSRLSALSRLLELDIDTFARPYRSVTSLTPLRSVTRLSLRGVDGLGSLAGWASLRVIRIWSCDDLVDAGCLSGLRHLTRVELVSCRKLADISALAGLTTLESVGLGDLPLLADPPLLGLLRLQSARLIKSRWSDTEDLAALTSLDMATGGHDYGDVCPLARLTRLEELKMSRSYVDAKSLGALTRLTSLHLERCHFKHTLSVAALTRLIKLEICHCDNLHSVEGLAGQEWLTEVTLKHMDNLRVLDLRGCARLRLLTASHCPSLASVDLREAQTLPVVDSRASPSVAVSISDESSGGEILLQDCGGRRVWLEAALDAETH